ncbi:MAG TPA: L-serine ammonia-lyase, iron-sulfur-dependent subunit beta [Bacillales bacterium]|nr:L-serine ammonia-lyase, iron-sulfur-dependent subunit beta [Bacillales bacterium]
MKFRSVFDVIGPVMIGPSSSHTAGAARIGRVARTLFGRKPERVDISLYGSFAKTYKGHGTDVALVGGLLDFDTSDPRIIEALSIAEQEGMSVHFVEEDAVTDHPNTVKLRLSDGREELEVVGVSIGGGKIEIIELNGFELRLSGNYPTIFVVHNDRFGVIAAVANLLAQHEINIGHMEVSRKEKGKQALMVIEVDQNVDDSVLAELMTLEHVLNASKLEN